MSSSSCEDHDSSDVLFPNVSTAAVPNQAAAEAGDRAVLTPLLRTVGNVAAGGGSPAMSQLLSHASGASAPLSTAALRLQDGGGPPAISHLLCRAPGVSDCGL